MGRNGKRRRHQRPSVVPPWERPFITEPPLRRARTGALYGAFGAALALAVGAVRIVFALASGRRISFDELRGLGFYAAGFVLAGAVVGLLWPWTRTVRGRYAVGVAGAAIGFFIMMQGFFGTTPSWDGAHWFTWVSGSLLFGAMIGYHLAD